jgi:zinc finger protein
MSDQKVNLFPSLGDIASRTNGLANVEDDDKRLAHDAPTLEEQEEGEEREVQEIESLCMRCHEQVSYRFRVLCSSADEREQRDCF